jgi:hypothetical protein
MKRGGEWIERLGLAPHPEGGYFREVYRSADRIAAPGLPSRYAGPRSLATSIYYLLSGEDISALHRLRTDEIWHFYLGSPLAIVVLKGSGAAVELRLGRNPAAGEVLQAVVPAGLWFGAFVLEPGDFSLVGCALAPGYDPADFELARREDLLSLYPEHRSVILKLTR